MECCKVVGCTGIICQGAEGLREINIILGPKGGGSRIHDCDKVHEADGELHTHIATGSLITGRRMAGRLACPSCCGNSGGRGGLNWTSSRRSGIANLGCPHRPFHLSSADGQVHCVELEG